MSRRTKHRSRLFGFLGLALLLHINLIVLVAFIISLFPERWQTRDTPLKPIDVALVPADELRQEQQLAGLEALKREELKKEEKKEEEKDKDLKGQVVDIAPPAEERQPDKARFLSEYDSRVAKEKKGPVMPTTPGRLMASRPPPQPRQPLPPEQREEVERKAMQLAMREPSDGRREGPRGEVPQAEVPRSDLPKDHGGDEPSKPDELPKQGGGDGRVAPGGAPPGKRLTMDDLRLSDEELGRAVGGRANDYLKDVDEGRAPVGGSEELSAGQMHLERMLFGFRTRWGLEASEISMEASGTSLEYLCDSGLIELHNKRIFPTVKGYLFADRLPLMVSA